MPALLLALALLAQDPAAPAAPALDDMPYPSGAPKDDYGLVSWCYGALQGYLELRPQAMPEVTRIESTFRAPGRTLEEDLKVYDDLEKESRANIKLFTRAMEAAEKASMRPINAQGAAAMQKGRSAWAAAANLTPARLGQEWMSWSLPGRCEPTARRLEERARLLGATFDPAAAVEPSPAADAPPESEATPAPNSPQE